MIITKPVLYPSSCPCLCPDWEYRDKGIWANQITTRVYGKDSKDNLLSLRAKFFVLLLSIAPLIAIRITYRSITLLTGDFIRSGRELAQEEWQIKSQKWSLSEASTPCPNRSSIIAKHVLWQLAKNVAKIVTYPIALVGLLLASLYGIFDPINGRAWFAAIEETWSRDALHLSKGDLFSSLGFRLGEFIAICMQPKDVWNAKNFYQGVPYYHPETLRSLLLSIQFLIEKKNLFFNKEGVNTQKILHFISTIQNHIKSVSSRDTLETNESSNLEQTEPQQRIKNLLKQVLEKLKNIENKRAIIVHNQINNSSQNNPGNGQTISDEILSHLDNVAEIINQAKN